MGDKKKPFTVSDKRSSSGQNEPKQETPENESPVAEPENKGAKLPPINFSTFVLSLSSSAAMSMGGYQDPTSGHIPKNLELAKQSIDILAILAEKTKGNLEEDEEKLLTSALYELRMKYVEEVKKG